MYSGKRGVAIASAAAVGVAAPAGAATLIIDEDGQLRGATGLNVEGALYDVEFVDTTCISAFSGCDSASDFDFDTGSSAEFAAQSLLDQVFIGVFDTDPTRVFGCDNGFACLTFIPYLSSGGSFTASVAVQEVVSGFDYTGFSSDPRDVDYGPAPARNFARFTPSAAVGAVPEPGTWMLLILGFFGSGAALRRTTSIRSLSVRYT